MFKVAYDSSHNEPLKIFNVNYHHLTVDAKKEVDCLAENIYFESASEPKEGKIAVAFVTLNRVKSGIFPQTVCGVVKQKVNNVCQFSWWCQEKQRYLSTTKRLTKDKDLMYNDIVDLATHIYINHEYIDDPSKGALFYHANYVNPEWRNLKKTKTIGKHIFYIKGENL